MKIFTKRQPNALINTMDIVQVRINNKDKLCTIGPDKVIQFDGDVMLPRMVVLATQMFHGNIRNRRELDGTIIPTLEDYLFLFWVNPLNDALVSPELPQGVLCATPVITRGQQNFKNYTTGLVGAGLNMSEVITTLKFTTYATKKEPKAGTVEFVQKAAVKQEAEYIEKLSEWLGTEEAALALTHAVGEMLNSHNIILLSDNYAEARKERTRFCEEFYGPRTAMLEEEVHALDSGAELLSLPPALEAIDLID